MTVDTPLPTLFVAAATGIALAAAVGLRVFVPLLLAGLAARTGHLVLADGFGWLASDPALVMFAVAALAELLASFIPLIDHALDVLGAPAAVAAGTLLAASALVDVSPWLRWAVALIAGGGTAGLVHGATAGVRAGSTVATAGLANPMVAVAELGGSALLVGLAVLVPVVALVLALVLALGIARRLRRRGAAVAVALVLATGSAGLPAIPAVAADEGTDGARLVDFRIKDQFDRLHTSGYYRGAVVVVVAGDRQGSKHIPDWSPALRDSVAGQIARHRVKFLTVAHLKGVPFFIKSTIKSKLPRDKEKWMLMDYEGLFKSTYAMPDDHCSLLVFDRTATLRMQRAVTGFDASVQSELISEIRRLASAPR